MNNVETIYAQLLLKYKRSRNWFVALNILAITLAAALVVLNLFAIRYNPVKTFHESNLPHHEDSYSLTENWIMWLFIALAIMSGVVAMMSSILSFFVFRRKAKKDKDKMELIKEQVKMHRLKLDSYADKDRDKQLIEKVTKIRNS